MLTNPTTELREANEYARTLYTRAKSQADAEGRDFTPSEYANIEHALDAARAIEKRVGATRTDQAMLAEIDKLTKGMTRERREARGNSLGALFMRSEAGDWLRQNAHRGTHWTTPIVEFDDPRFGGELHATTITTNPASGGVLVIPQYLPDIVPVPLRPPVVADLLGSAPTTTNLIIYTQETQITNAAATVVEGGTKPEGAITFAPVQEPVQKIAWWLPVTDELLDDVPAMANYINERLVAGLQVTEDDQLLNGNGTAPNLNGLLNRTLAPDVARGTDTNVDAIAKQISAIETANPGVRVTGLIMHPTNYLSSRLMKTTTNDYIGGSPFQPVMPPALWGLPVALTTAIPLGTALCVSRASAMVFRRSGIVINASNSHQDFFIKNLTAIRCEERLALVVFRAAAFGKVTGLN